MSRLSKIQRTTAVRKYILARWEETIRSNPEDIGTLIGLPYPYSVPCCKGAFQELYYWDTFFTSLGLIGSDRIKEARNNVLNLIHLAERFGFVPNGNRTYYLTRSQPPYLGAMVALMEDVSGDASFACRALGALEREYEFWVTRRLTPTGLSQYRHHASPEELMKFFETIKYRHGCPHELPEESLSLAFNTMAECEGGMDFSSRYEGRCPEYCPVDLNTNLWLNEILLSRWSIESKAKKRWCERADRRRRLINRYCWDEERQGFFDYNFINEYRSQLVTAAAFQPLWVGLATPAQAAAVVRHLLPRLEFDYGVVSIEPLEPSSRFQWDYPGGWACSQYLVYSGLERYGYHEDAQRIARKYVDCVSRVFAETGELWEKYNVVDGNNRATQEDGYLVNPDNHAEGTAHRGAVEEPPAMMGWTAGVFIHASNFLEEGRLTWLP